MAHSAAASTRESGAGGVRVVGYGSTDLEKLLDLLRGDSSVIRLRAGLPWPHTRSLAHEASTALRLRTRARMTYRETQASHASYVFAHYMLNAVSEETYEKLVTALVNQSTLAPVPALATHIEDAHLFTSRPGGSLGVGGHPWPEICTALHREASRAALQHLRPFVERLKRRRTRDAVLRGTYHLQWRSAERILPVIWNPLLRTMEPLACDDCGQGGLEMTIGDQLHLRCGNCTAGAC